MVRARVPRVEVGVRALHGGRSCRAGIFDEPRVRAAVGMFDDYVPWAPVACPRCGARLKGWQGKGGPCLGWKWRQYQRWAQSEDEQGWHSEERAYVPDELRLPADFDIYTECGECGAWVDAECRCVQGVWRLMKVLPLRDSASRER